MKRKIFTLLLAVLVVGGLVAQKNPRPLYTVKKATTAPAIDGTIDPTWDTIAKANIELPFNNGTAVENPTLPGDNTFQVLWDDAGVYVLLQSQDDVFRPDCGSNNWMFDKPELYFDCNVDLHDGGNGRENGHYQVAPGWAAAFYAGGLQVTGSVQYAHVVDEATAAYIWEYFMPWEYLLDGAGAGFNQADTMGFDITLIDNDLDACTEGRDRMVWSNDNNTTEGSSNESWNNSDGLGYLLFEGGVAPEIVPVTDINILANDNVITEDGGTLELALEVLPEDATVKGVDWIVTGPVFFNPKTNLIITAWRDGVIQVIAKAKDGSGVADTLEITVSGQVQTLNLLQNAGGFDNASGTTHPAKWSGWLDGATGSTLDMTGGLINGFSDNFNNGPNEWWHFQFLQVGNENGWALDNDTAYVLYFDGWGDSERKGYCDFEDPENGYNRFGTSMSPDAINPTGGDVGRIGFTFNLSTTSQRFAYDIVGNGVKYNTKHQFGYMMSSDSGGFHFDNLYLIKVSNLPEAVDSFGYVMTSGVTVTGAGGATTITVDDGTLQMNAAVTPAEAYLKTVVWSVENGTGEATIDKTGLLKAVKDGTVTVKAKAFDGGAVGTLEVTISNQVGVKDIATRSFRMFPNPVVDVLNVQTREANSTIVIYNSVGQKVLESVTTGTEARFNVSNFANGVYFVRVNNGAAQKFVK